MATAAFRSTSKRSSIAGAADAGSSTRCGAAHRRARSLSRGPAARFPPPSPDPGELPTPRGKFVNKARGSGFPEISLDDLADEFFRSKYEDEVTPPDGRTTLRVPGVNHGMEREERSWRRGRSASRRGVDGNGFVGNSKKGEGFGENGGLRRRQRSLSVVRHRGSDLESCSSALTDDEVRDVHPSKSRSEKTKWTVCSQQKTVHPSGDSEGSEFYETMHKEVRHAVAEIRTELERIMLKAGPTTKANQPSNVVQSIAEIRRKYTSEMVQTEKRKQDLLAQLAAEEERGKELTKIVRELLPVPKQTAATEKQLQSRRKSNDRTRMSRHLTEEAEKYFEDFLLNVEDTDISSFDGERSDTSSSLGGSAKFRNSSVQYLKGGTQVDQSNAASLPVDSNGIELGSTKIRDSALQLTTGETHVDLLKSASSPAETDGVLLPWLQWEASSCTLPSQSKTLVAVDMGNNLSTRAQREAAALGNSHHCTSSSRGSWSPECTGSSSIVSKHTSGIRVGELGSLLTNSYRIGYAKGSSFDMDEYLDLKSREDLLFESIRQRQRIDSGGLILCGRFLI